MTTYLRHKPTGDLYILTPALQGRDDMEIVADEDAPEAPSKPAAKKRTAKKRTAKKRTAKKTAPAVDAETEAEAEAEANALLELGV